MQRLVWCLALALIQGAWCRAARAEGVPPQSQPATTALAAATQPSSDQANLLALGDTGEDTMAERQVAAALAKYVQAHDREHFAATLLCGDNFYFKLTGIDDPRWDKLFRDMYDAKVLDMPFFACLGNHDYDGDNARIEIGYARRHPASRFKLPGAWYRIDLPPGNPMVTVIMLDSNKDNMSEARWNQQIEWLTGQLAGPRARWTICCAHHPLFSNGFFIANGVLQKDWGALFEQYGVDFYLSGHEHNLQHLEIPGWRESFVIAGGGGAHAHPLFRADRGFSREVFGFVHFQFTPQRATVRVIDAADKPIHIFERTKSGKVRVTQTTPNSEPEKNALKAYLELRNRKPSTQPAEPSARPESPARPAPTRAH